MTALPKTMSKEVSDALAVGRAQGLLESGLHLYERRSSAPAWYYNEELPAGTLFASATSGSSRFNEYYAFPSREAAIKYINKTFNSQSYLEEFIAVRSEIWRREDVDISTDESWNTVFSIREGALPANLDDMVRAESKF